MKRFEGDTALITGAAGFIGSRIAKRFAREGAQVVLCDWNEEQARKVADEIRETGGEAMAIKVNVKQSDDARMAVAKTMERYGKI
ncbi:MAG TPA: SDR family NAD(P)-dependent oxidoreductase, partial [Clostridia bacterium]|nr:SDR family NAD(P)-dependent oxidoreductase [Clostridia bacterium]